MVIIFNGDGYYTKIMVSFVLFLIHHSLSLLMISVNLHFNDTLKGRIAIERNINSLKDWVSSNFIKFNKDKCNLADKMD